MRHYLSVGPTSEPVIPQDVIADRGMGTADATAALPVLTRLITTARMQAEEKTGRALITQTWIAKLDDWPYCDEGQRIQLPVQKVQSITSITYTDTNGDSQTLAADQYQLTGWDSSIIAPTYGVVWPSLYNDVDVVTITWAAGYGDDASDVPEPIKSWIIMQAGTLYENREAAAQGQPFNLFPLADGLLDFYKVIRA